MNLKNLLFLAPKKIKSLFTFKRKEFSARVFFGPACSPKFVADCCQYLAFSPQDSKFANFADGESWVQLMKNVREQEVFIIQPTPQPDKNWMILWEMIDAAKRASASKIIVIMPYCGYLRQDRKDKPRVALTAKMVLRFTEKVGADRIVVMDPHFSQVQGYVEIPLDVLYGSKLFQDNLNFSEFDMVIACDGGATKIAISYVDKYELKFGQAIKIRKKHNKINKMILALEEPIEGKKVLLVDEMIDTAGTLFTLVDMIKERGAKKIVAVITHGILSGEAIEKINNHQAVDHVYLLDTVNLTDRQLSKKISILPSGKFFGEIVRRIHFKESLSSLFD